MTDAEPRPDYSKQNARTIDLMVLWSFTEREIRILDYFRRLSFHLGRPAAPFFKQRHICALTGLGENDVSTTLKGLFRKGVLVQTERGWIGIQTDTNFWRSSAGGKRPFKPLFAETEETSKLRSWLSGLQLDSPELFPEPSLTAALLEVNNNLPTRGAGPSPAAVHPNRSDPDWDAKQEPTDGALTRESARAARTEPAGSPQPAGFHPTPSQFGKSSFSNREDPNFSNREDHKTTPAGANKTDLLVSGSSPLNALSVSTVSQCNKAVETLKGDRRQRWRKGEDEFLQSLELTIGQKAMQNWGGFWRIRYRQSPDLVQDALDDLKLRLTNAKPCNNPGGWMRSQYERRLHLQK